MAKLSAVVITYNEEKNLGRCLGSLQGVADEVIVVDSNSTDGTVAIAQQYKAKIYQRDFDGYGQQKNYATQQATNDWVLSLDADEELTDELRNSILAVKAAPGHDVYQMPRLTNYCGQWIKHCGWYPDKQTRLYNRTKGRWVEQKVHEYWQHSDKNAPKGLLAGDLLHYSFATINDHLKKIEKYSELGAQEAIAKGKSASLLKVWFSPVWHFISEYIFRLGFLDGYYGFVICRLSAYASYTKYSKIRAYRKSGLNELKQ
jgi:glycosyltransferase involved in cell wall biosynthesis